MENLDQAFDEYWTGVGGANPDLSFFITGHIIPLHVTHTISVSASSFICGTICFIVTFVYSKSCPGVTHAETGFQVFLVL